MKKKPRMGKLKKKRNTSERTLTMHQQKQMIIFGRILRTADIPDDPAAWDECCEGYPPDPVDKWEFDPTLVKLRERLVKTFIASPMDTSARSYKGQVDLVCPWFNDGVHAEVIVMKGLFRKRSLKVCIACEKEIYGV